MTLGSNKAHDVQKLLGAHLYSAEEYFPEEEADAIFKGDNNGPINLVLPNCMIGNAVCEV